MQDKDYTDANCGHMMPIRWMHQNFPAKLFQFLSGCHQDVCGLMLS